jgi:hypothetical protein
MAVEKHTPERDVWLEVWAEQGMKVDPPIITFEPEKFLMCPDARPLCKGRPFYGTQLRRYSVDHTDVQVVVLPDAALLPELPQGRHVSFHLKPKGYPVHVFRIGRQMILVAATMQETVFFGRPPTPQKFVDRMFDLFEKTADGRS